MQAIHPLLSRAQATGAPLIDDESVTFVWYGANPPALVGDFNAWNPAQSALAEVAPDVWTQTLVFPRDTYMEYAFIVDPAKEERVPDPFNARVTPNGMGKINHYFYMPDGGPTPLAKRKRGVPRGEVTRHVIHAPHVLANSKRMVWLYRPAASGPVPLVVVFDGRDYLRRAMLATIADNLIAQGRMRPVAFAMADNGGPARVVEYGCCEPTLGFIIDNLLSLAKSELDLVDFRTSPGAYGLLGASMGGLMALYVALRAPGIFGHVLSQSGAFWDDEYKPVVVDLVRDGAVRPIKVWMDAGRYEGLLGGNRMMHALLQQRGYDVAYCEFNGGHNYPAWRDDVARGLEWLYSG
ncbi:MAG: alpha/beta hydrolase-fold protein [Chloroflexi bacterium]|nr:alpha/beta hydrolase-fold protein [Chloroflexota bacterium]